jgi:hypothetical protein
MNTKMIGGLTASLLLALSAGCTSTPGIVRGQNPAEYGQHAQASDAPGTGQTPALPVYFDGSPNDGPFLYPSQGYCPNGMCPPYGDGSYGDGSRPRGLWNPSHHHVYDYHTPKNLVYPPDCQQPAMVQYPYYTVKGPTDFFMK